MISEMNNIEAEAALLNCLICYSDKEGLSIKEDIFLEISDNDFTGDYFRQVFAACKKLFISSQPIDVITLTEIGINVPTAILICSPSNATYKTYIAIVKKNTYSRQLLKISEELKENADDPYKARDIAMSKLSEIGESILQEVEDFSETVEQAAEYIKKLKDGKQVNDGIKSPFSKLNYYLGSFQKGEVAIIAARPSVGKSAFLNEIILKAVLKDKKPVLLFNLEMSKQQIALRMYSNIIGKSVYEFKNGNVSENEILTAKNILSSANMIVDTKSNTIERILRTCRVQNRMQDGLGLICVDYLQLVTSAQGYKDRRLEVEHVSRQLKLLAIELNVPVIALSQMSRSIEMSDREPNLSDLRESGAIEQDATSVLFLHRMKPLESKLNYRPDIDRFLALFLAKNRNGATGSLFMKFEADKMRFVEIDESGKEITFIGTASKQVELKEIETEDNPF